jgi:hypothetical protein
MACQAEAAQQRRLVRLVFHAPILPHGWVGVAAMSEVSKPRSIEHSLIGAQGRDRTTGTAIFSRDGEAEEVSSELLIAKREELTAPVKREMLTIARKDFGGHR